MSSGFSIVSNPTVAFRPGAKLLLHPSRDLPRLVQSAVGKLMNRWHHQDTRLSTYKLTEIEDRTAHDLIVRATDVGVRHRLDAQIDPGEVAQGLTIIEGVFERFVARVYHCWRK